MPRDRFYISGKVTGEPYLPCWNKFLNLEKRILNGNPDCIVRNPMRLCKSSWSWLRCIVVCLWYLTFSNTVIFLPDYKESRGARIEHRYAQLLGKGFVYNKEIEDLNAKH